MLYDAKMKQVMLGILEKRVSGIASSINKIADNGFVPNKNKINILDWGTILIHAYENIDLFSKEQQDNLDIISNRVLKL